MPTQLLLTKFLNAHFAGPANALLNALHVPAALNALHMPAINPQQPINNTFAMELLVFLLLVSYFLIVRLTLSVETPGGLQHLAEMTNEFVTDQGEQIIGHEHARFNSFLTAMGLFILVSNLMGLVPGLESPTADIVVPLGFAVTVFLYYHFNGIRANGFGYIKQFLGPVWWLYWLLFPIEVISHCARVLSLSVRLYANMFAGDLLTLVAFSIIPLGVPLLALGLHLGVAVIQAYVFFLLAAIYLSMAVAHEH